MNDCALFYPQNTDESSFFIRDSLCINCSHIGGKCSYGSQRSSTTAAKQGCGLNHQKLDEEEE